MVQLLDYYDLAISLRYVVGSTEDQKRYVYNLIYNTLLKIPPWHTIRDNLSGFFPMRRESLLAFDMDGIFCGYGKYFIWLNYFSLKRNYTMLEIPVFYRLRPHRSSKSNFLL